MSKSKTKKDKTPSPKKEFRNQITEQLKNALNGLEQKLGKKEFEARIKKAGKLLAAGIKTKLVKPAKSNPVKKNSVTSEETAA